MSRSERRLKKEQLHNNMIEKYHRDNDKYSKLLKERELNTLSKEVKVNPKKLEYPKFKSVISKKHKQSKGEELIELILKERKLGYLKEVQFKGCVNKLTKKSLRFDFFIESLGICIEFDGEQHFHQVKEFDGNDGGKAFRKRRKLDQIKDNYCKSNAIKLVRIKYTQIGHIEDIINKL